MARVLDITPLSSLTGQEADLLRQLFAKSGHEWDTSDLVVYVVQTLVRPEEKDHLALGPEDIRTLEAPKKLVAPSNGNVAVGSFVQNYSGQEWSATIPHAEQEQAQQLSLAPALTTTDERGEPI